MKETLVKDFINAIKNEDKKTSAYDTTATVTRVDGNTAWVHIAGGVDETPVKLTVNAEKGDSVQVRVGGGRAWITGNASAPPTDDRTANAARYVAQTAQGMALRAEDTASAAQIEAARAKEAADEAEATADAVHGLAEQAIEDASEASSAAGQASLAAEVAQASAQTAFNQLSVVENIVGVLDMLSQHGTYALTQDIEVQANKWYFTRSGSGTEADPYRYDLVRSPTAESLSTYYELTGLDEAITNYVSSHLALTNEGLNLQNGATRVLLSSTQGLIFYDEGGNIVARYGANTVIGDLDKFGIKIGESPESTALNPIYELGFYQNGNRVAYINNNSLYITQTVVLQEMKVGDSVYGIWSWKVHIVNNRYNLYLKWLG